MRHARLEAGRVRQNVVSKRRAHSVGSAAAAAGVAPLTRVLSSVISSTMCLASAKTAAVTMPARWTTRLLSTTRLLRRGYDRRGSHHAVYFIRRGYDAATRGDAACTMPVLFTL